MTGWITKPWAALAPMLRSWWAERGTAVLRAAVALMAVVAVVKLGMEFRRLVWDWSFMGAIDMKLRWREIHYWFAGYLALRGYQPAAYVMLWPLLGWMDEISARWLWALTTVGMLAWLVRILVRESGARTPLERAFIVLLVLSMNAV